jgi:protein-disulfide isomerase
MTTHPFPTATRWALAVTALLLTPTWFACSTPRAGKPTEDPSPTAAIIDGTSIDIDELDTWIKNHLYEQQTRNGDPSRTYQVRRDALDRMIQERALDADAKRLGVDVDAAIQQEIDAIGPVTDGEVVAFFAENRERFGTQRFDDLSPRIRQHLEQQQRQEAIEVIVARADVRIDLVQPRVQVAADGPSLGPDDAPVTIIEFSDFQCPYCKRASPIVHRLAEKYPEQVRIVYRHMPLDSIHPRARAAAEASACADDQGLFWEYHDQIFANSSKLSDEDLLAFGTAVGVDEAVFAACVETRKHAEAVQADVADATSAGITGTPAFVVNGIVLYGLQSEDDLDKVIRAELDEAS